MNWYSLHEQNQECSLNILEIGSNKLLFLRNFSQERMLNYLPTGETIKGDEEGEEPLKKMKLDQNERVYESPKNEHYGSYYTRLKGKPYIINQPMRLDVSILENVDINSIDFILLSSTEDVFLLPYLLKQKKMRARVFSTVPVAQVGSHVLLEFIKLIYARNRTEGGNGNQEINQAQILQQIGQDSFFAENELFEVFERECDEYINEWVDIYSIEDVMTSFQRIETMSYGQQLQLEGTNIIIQPVASGYSLGSCLWIIDYENVKSCVMNNGNKHQYRYTPTIDCSKLIGQLDFLFLTPSLNNTKDYISIMKSNQNSFNLSEAYFLKFSSILQEQLSTQRVNVVLPLRDGSVVLELLDLFEKKMATFTRHIYIVSESTNAFIQLGNSSVEFLTEKLQQKIFTLESPQSPFSAADAMAKTEFLDIYQDFSALQQQSKYLKLSALVQAGTPSIYIVIDSTLRLGSTLKILKMIDESVNKKESVSATVILTDPFMQSQIVTQPIIGLFRNKIFYAPLDFRMHIQEFCELLKEIKPKVLIYPRHYQEIQIFLEDLREQNIHKITAYIYGNDQAVQLQLPTQESKQFKIQKKDVEQLKLLSLKNNMIKVGSITYQPNHEKGEIITKRNSDIIFQQNEMDMRSLSSSQSSSQQAIQFQSQSVILVLKNQHERHSEYSKITSALTSEYQQQGYTQELCEVQRDGFKLKYKHQSNQQQYIYIKHSPNYTLIFTSHKDITNHIAQQLKQKLLIIDYNNSNNNN